MSRSTPQVITTTLRVPAMPCVVDGGVFDAWAWCASDELTWRRLARFDVDGPLEMANPPDLVFVMSDVERCAFLPRELTMLHAKGFALADSDWALAPYAIDDATDLLFEHRVRPRDVLWLAAPSLAALVWGLHDWAHFHNHGPFDDPPMTELGCDLLALAWLRLNREAIGLTGAHLERIAAALASLTRQRFEEARRPTPCDVEALFAGGYPAEALVRTSAP